MKPAPFAYQRAENLQHACELLNDAGEDSKILAGGQSLIPMMNFRLARPRILIDISNIAERNQVSDEAGGIRVRSTTVQRFVERSPSVRTRLPLLFSAIQHIAHFQIRNKGTIGGNLANADPASELPAISLALDAEFEVISTEGQRRIPASEFFITYMTTSLAPTEILSSVLFAEPSKNSGWGFHEVARRHGDYALAGSAAVVTLDQTGKCSRARIVLFGLATTPVRATVAEDMLIGHVYSTSLLTAAAHAVQEAIDPEGDMHVTAEYRRSVAEILTVRALEDAFRRAKLC
jgi:carbon-monoxide dehydrogenase medium subunit